MRRHLALAGAAGLAVLTLAPMSAHAAESEATVSVLHAVLGLTVDVYANGEELILTSRRAPSRPAGDPGWQL